MQEFLAGGLWGRRGGEGEVLGGGDIGVRGGRGRGDVVICGVNLDWFLSRNCPDFHFHLAETSWAGGINAAALRP